MFKEAMVWVGGFILLLVTVFLLNVFGLFNYSFFAPKYRAVENQVFKESEQYNDGMIRDLQNLQMEYMSADQARSEEHTSELQSH